MSEEVQKELAELKGLVIEPVYQIIAEKAEADPEMVGIALRGVKAAIAGIDERERESRRLARESFYHSTGGARGW